MDKTNRAVTIKATVDVIVSALLFSLGGIMIKLLPWSSFSINCCRSFFAAGVILLYMKYTHHKFLFNKAVLLGAVSNSAMSLTYVAAAKLTTAAAAIVLQFTEPIFVILIMWFFYHRKPSGDAVLTCVVTFGGIVCFFLENLSGRSVAGAALAILSGFAYAFVFLMKKFKNGDFESSIVLSFLINIVIGVWSVGGEKQFNMHILLILIIFSVLQYGLPYIFLSRGLDHVSPVTASLTSAIEPIANPIIVAVFYGETIGALAVAGAFMVLGASLFYNLRQIQISEKTDG